MKQSLIHNEGALNVFLLASEFRGLQILHQTDSYAPRMIKRSGFAEWQVYQSVKRTDERDIRLSVSIQPSVSRTTKPSDLYPSSELLGYFHPSALRTNRKETGPRPPLCFLLTLFDLTDPDLPELRARPASASLVARQRGALVRGNLNPCAANQTPHPHALPSFPWSALRGNARIDRSDA